VEVESKWVNGRIRYEDYTWHVHMAELQQVDVRGGIIRTRGKDDAAGALPMLSDPLSSRFDHLASCDCNLFTDSYVGCRRCSVP